MKACQEPGSVNQNPPKGAVNDEIDHSVSRDCWDKHFSWFLKIKLRRNMEEGLGRKVDDGELTSISAWMKLPRKDMPYPRDRNPHI
jgi:hypothetical protein